MTLYVVVVNADKECAGTTGLCVASEDVQHRQATLFFDVLEAMATRDRLEELFGKLGHTYTVHALEGT